MTGQKVGMLAALLMCGALAMPVMAQNAGGNAPAAGGTNPPAQPQGGGGGAAGFRQRMMDNLKTRLGITDDAEFAAIQPKIEKVMQLQRDANGGGMRGMMGGNGGRNGRGNRNGGGNNGTPAAAPAADVEQSPVQKASSDLQTTLDDKNATPDDIKAKLQAFRDAKSKAKDDLTAAQKDLQSVLSQRQEAVLVMMGLLN